jgi:predicted dehydrogenase
MPADVPANDEMKMGHDVSIALVGIGGYGAIYGSALLAADAPPGHRLVAAVDPYPELSPHRAELARRGIPIHTSLESLSSAAERPIDLVVVSSPIHLHCQHTAAALAHGSHVLCEKPVCVTPEQSIEMMRVRDEHARQVSVGYQWSFSPAIQRLKRDISAGVLGEPRRLTTMVLWPRDEAYYLRNRWAGRRYTSQGVAVFDSPVNNACAHYLHNMLYVLGDQPTRSAAPAKVVAELYRANGVETYDTAAIRCWTAGGVEIVFLVSHSTRICRGPVFRFEFTEATVTYDEDCGELAGEEAGGGRGRIVATFKDGTTRDYGVPPDGTDMGKLWASIASARDGVPTLCGIEASFPQTQVAWAAQQSMPQVAAIPRELLRVEGINGKRRTWVQGLDGALVRCFEQNLLPSELGEPWAVAGREVIVGRSSPDASEDHVSRRAIDVASPVNA